MFRCTLERYIFISIMGSQCARTTCITSVSILWARINKYSNGHRRRRRRKTLPRSFWVCMLRPANRRTHPASALRNPKAAAAKHKHTSVRVKLVKLLCACVVHYARTRCWSSSTKYIYVQNEAQSKATLRVLHNSSRKTTTTRREAPIGERLAN